MKTKNTAAIDLGEWDTIRLQYQEGTRYLKAKYSPLLREEILSKQGKDTSALAGIFVQIANKNIKLAQRADILPTLTMQYYNDAAIACHHALSIMKKASAPNLALKNQVYEYLNIIQINIVNISGEASSKLQEIKSQADINNIAKRDIIEKIRIDTKDQLKAIETAKEEKNDQEYIERSAKLFKQIATDMAEYLEQLYKEAEKILGEPPCEYTVVGLGSMALCQMTPYSDLEFAILTANDEYKQDEHIQSREYFNNLTQIVHFKVINLGETVIPTSSYDLNFKDHITTAVNFDLGGKTPLGRIEKDKPYELIQTVEGMINYLRNDENKTSNIDKNLPNILQKICHIHQHGKTNLTSQYQTKAQEFLQSMASNNRPYCENRAVQMLSEGGIEIDYTKQITKKHQPTGNLEQFSLDAQARGKLFDVKQEIYRMPDRFIYNLGLVYGVQEESGWDTIDKLNKKGFISADGALNLKKALSFATNLRLKTYSHYGYQKDTMDYAKAYEVMNAQSKDELVEKELIRIFRLTRKDLETDGELFEFYYVTLALRKELQKFCSQDNIVTRENAFIDIKFYQDDAYTKAEISLRLLKFDEALKYQLEVLAICQKDLGEDHPDVANSLGSIGYTYGELSNYQEALKCHKKAQKIYEARDDLKNHSNLTIIFTNIGITYHNIDKNHEAALAYHKKALKIAKDTSNSSDIARSLNNIGTIHEELKEYNEALDCHKKALKIYKICRSPNHPDVASSFLNIGTTYKQLEIYDKALYYNKEALNKFQEYYTQDYPSITTSLTNIGETYRALGNPNKALEYMVKALGIRRESLGEDHQDVAQSLYNIGYIYLHLCRHDEAIKKITSVIDIYKKNNQTEKIQENIENIKNIKLAKNYYEKSEGLLAKQENVINSNKTPKRKLYLSKKAIKPLEEALNSFKICSKLADGEKIQENILKTLSLLIKAHGFLNQPKKSTSYKKEHDALKKAIEEKQLKLQEVEGYLPVQKQGWEKQDVANKISNVTHKDNLSNSIVVESKKEPSEDEIIQQVELQFRSRENSNTINNNLNADNHWYSDAAITSLLIAQIDESQGRIIAITQFENNSLLEDNLKNALEGVQNGIPVLMPIHVHGNHWVGAVIRKQQDGNIQVIYNDPKGNSIQDEKNIDLFIKIIQRYAPEANIIDLQIKQQDNDNDCGPFTIDNLIRLARVYNIDNFSKEQLINTEVFPNNNTGSNIREAHKKLLLDRIEEEKNSSDEARSTDTMNILEAVISVSESSVIEEGVLLAANLINQED